MSDIVERLKRRAAPLTRARELSPTAALCREAAAEIERLRAVPQPVPVTADQAAEDVRREREAKSERDRYANMTTAEKCAVQGDGFINDYD